MIRFPAPHILPTYPGIFLGALFWCATVSSSELTDGTPEEAGLRVSTQAREVQKGFGNLTANLTMTLRDKQGRENYRELHLKILEVAGDGDRTVFLFDRPRDVKGTAFLIHSHKYEADQQWLYLPALKRVKRISSSKQSGSFMGSEFSYEDMGAVEVEKFTHRYLREEPCGDLDCLVLERTPKSQDSGYSRQLVWFDREALLTRQVQYFNRRDSHIKTMIMEDYQQYLDRFWRASRITMTNHLTGKSTVLDWSDYDFAADLDTRDFTKTALRRVK